ncbi:putative hydroxymethylpyrimidine transporter CytX [Sedimentibacter sp. zth1]|uniref:putative hydroxymethylpyrimidine transporter CytX n=1 Tax=Sedimentibacter sp. zth1 TaxID=2816908 RepID=UPI001A935602|nr:putative hydroxymethylpyrimidine transporter CytX [Sedimentibacter sp. zth1]QSX06311.1 putative hydroxymethylpyrimidine transporter CytX [Sedimentibacter sp. zth1]
MNKSTKLTNASQGLLWFGAAISLAEILTGALIAPIGFEKGLLAIVIGHVIGCVILYFAGLIGAKSKLSAIESTRLSFGKYGSYIFSVLNILQLVGWTAVMIINGAKAINVVTLNSFNFQNEIVWCVLIAALMGVWIIIGFENLSKVNKIAVNLLFIFVVILGFVVFKSNSKIVFDASQSISFGAAVELSVIMPLSWLPLISDYTKSSKDETKGTLFSAIGYFIGSCFMYIIGIGAALYAGNSDISVILSAAGLPIIALVIVMFSTVTTGFLDVYSAAVSYVNLNKKANEKIISVIICIIGLVIAITVPTSQFEPFLYLIGSVFAPLFAITITDFFIIKNNKLNKNNVFNLKNSIIWVIGVVLYRIFMNIDTILGSTLPVMVAISIICIVVNYIIKSIKK